jgi:hypothetical protein
MNRCTKRILHFILHFRLYLLIILYNGYLFSALIKGAAVVACPAEHSVPVPHFIAASAVSADQLFLLNDDNTVTYKTKIQQVKKEKLLYTPHFHILKTYIQHNNLHYNIPIICLKFPVSQSTSDG